MPLVVQSGIYVFFYVGFCELLMNRTQLPYHSVVVTKFTIYGPWLPMKVPFRDHTQMCYGEPQILKEVMRKAGFVVDGPLCLAFFFGMIQESNPILQVKNKATHFLLYSFFVAFQ